MYLIKITNIYNALSLTASEEVTGFEVGKLQNPFGSTRWRSTGLTPFIVGQFDTARTVQFWAPWYTNAKSGDQTRLRLASTQANLTVSPLLDTGFVDVWPAGSDLSTWEYVHQRTPIATADQVSAQWLRIDFDYTGNADGYVEVGALLIDTIFNPAAGHAVGWQFTPETRGSFSNLTGAGGQSRGQGTFKRPIEFELYSLTPAETWGELDEIFRTLGTTLPIGVVLSENESTYPMNFIYYGYMNSRVVSTRDRYIVRVSITEP